MNLRDHIEAAKRPIPVTKLGLFLYSALIGVAMVVVIVLGVLYLRDRQREGVRSRALLAAIQHNRYQTTLENCLAQNKRHDNTIAAFHEEAAAYVKKHPEEKAALEENVKANIRLIDALQPREKDCKAKADQVRAHP